MFSAIKSFAKRNRVLFILLIVAFSITLSNFWGNCSATVFCERLKLLKMISLILIAVIRIWKSVIQTFA